jgi:hypothetical protein
MKSNRMGWEMGAFLAPPLRCGSQETAPQQGEMMNKTGKTSLRAMNKTELIEFCWTLVQHYNVAVNRGDELQTHIDYLEKLIIGMRNHPTNTGETK